MCSCRTYVPMIACILIPGFELRAALRDRPRLASAARGARAAARNRSRCSGPSPPSRRQPGSGPGMRLGEALATCPSLVLVEQDPAAVEQAWEAILAPARRRGLRGRAGRARLPSTSRRAGSSGSTAALEPALKRALAAVGTPGTLVRAQPSAGSPRSPRRTSRARARPWSSPTSALKRVPRAAAAELLPLEPGGARSSTSSG